MNRVLPMAFLAIFFLVTTSWGQRLSIQQQEQVIQKITSTITSIQTMQCDFMQTKKMKMLKKEIKSSGVMYFKSPNKLRWQYKTPYSYIFVMNGNKILLKSSKVSQNIDTQGNKMFKRISNIILGCIMGESLRSSTDFSVEICKENSIYVAKLLPKKKELKSLYNNIKICFNSYTNMVESVEMSEKTGDITIVNLNNIKKKSPISENIFTVN